MSKQGPKDANELAFRIMQEAVGEAPPSRETIQGKNPAAVALGRLGGLKGGKARAANMSAEKRSEIAKAAAIARWKKAQA